MEEVNQEGLQLNHLKGVEYKWKIVIIYYVMGDNEKTCKQYSIDYK